MKQVYQKILKHLREFLAYVVTIFIKYAIGYSPALQSTCVVAHHASSQAQLLSEVCMVQGRVTLAGQTSLEQEPKMFITNPIP